MGANFKLAYQPREYDWSIECSCGAVRVDQIWSTYADAREAFATAAPCCGDEYCAAFPGSIVPLEDEDELLVAVSGKNSTMLVQLLGYGANQYQEGEADAADFLGRVLLAQGINPADAGVPAIETGNWTDCGRSENYSERRLSDLRRLAEAGVAEGRSIVWS